jgi:transposase
MGSNFIDRDGDRAFLLPQDIRQWLPPEHLCWKVMAVVGEMDLSAFLAGYRADGQGAAAYHPEVMVALVLYCYGKGIRSSREIEAACVDDVGCRIITANHRVDHATIARFIGRHRAALDGLFVQVLAVCARWGLVDVGAVAIGGSPVEANAAMSSNRTLEQLEMIVNRGEAQITALMWEVFVCARRAESGDGGESAENRRAWTTPARLSRLADRVARACSARDRLYQRALPSAGEIGIKVAAARRMVTRAERRLAVAASAQQARLEAHGRRARAEQAAGRRGATGRPPVQLEAKTAVVRQRARLARALAHLKDVSAPRPCPSAMARACLSDPDSRLLPGKRGGFLQGYNLQIACVRRQVLVAIALHENPADMTALVPVVRQAECNCAAAGITEPILAWLADAGYACTANFEALADLPLLVAVVNEREQTDRAAPSAAEPVRAGWQEMAARLDTPAGRNLYKRRGALVEPGFAQLFQRFGRYLNYRGTAAANTEAKLLGTVHNLSKLFLQQAKNPRLTAA